MQQDLPPALPWANPAVPEDSSAQPTQEEELTSLELEAVDLVPGKKIQVRWEVEQTTESDDGQNETKHTTKWWPATVVGPVAPPTSAQPKDASGEPKEQGEGAPSTATPFPQPVFEIQYEKFETFNEERCLVMFTSPHSLVDITDQTSPDYLVWRLEGDDKEYGFADEEDQEQEGQQEEEDHTYTAKELMELTAHRRDSEDMEAKFLESLEPCQQRDMAAGYRTFIDGFKNFLESKFAGQAGGGTVTAEDVRGYTEQLHKKRRQA